MGYTVGPANGQERGLMVYAAMDKGGGLWCMLRWTREGERIVWAAMDKEDDE